MRILVALSTAALMLISCGYTQAQWDVINNDCPDWKMEAAIMAIDRPGDNNGVPLVSNSQSLQTLFNSGQATDLNTAPGLDISLQFNRCSPIEHEIEAMFAQWDNAYDFFGPNLETPFLPGLSPDEINYRYESNLFSLEWNARQEIAPGFTFLCGPRFVYLDETINVDSATTIVPPIPDPIFIFETETIIDTKNPLFGAQIGGELDFLLTQSFRIHGFIKAGAYANFSSAFIEQTDSLFGTTESDQQKSAGSFVGETGVRLYYTIIPSACSFYAGYEAMWIDNVALAPVQFVTVNNVNNDVILGVTPFFQAAVFGLEFIH